MEYETRMLIGGELVIGEGPLLEVENPATEAVVATVGSASESQLDRAVAAADDARAEWAAMPAVDRAPLLHDIASKLRGRAD